MATGPGPGAKSQPENRQQPIDCSYAGLAAILVAASLAIIASISITTFTHDWAMALCAAREWGATAHAFEPRAGIGTNAHSHCFPFQTGEKNPKKEEEK